MDEFIRYSFYTSFLVSIGIVVYIFIQPHFIQVQNAFDRIRDKNEYQVFLQKTRYFLERSIGKSSLLAAYIFLVSLVLVFVISFVAFLIGGNNLFNAFGLSSAILMGIYFIFYALAYRNEVVITHEGILLIEELINNYKIYHKNIIETIERTSETLSDLEAPLSKKMLKNLAFRIRHARNDDMVHEALKQLVNVINVSWAHSLSSVFNKAITQGIDVEVALTDIKKQLEDLEQLKEAMKDEIYEAKAMIMYVMPLMAVITVAVVVGMFEIPLNDYLRYQFGEGVTYLIAIIAMIIGSIGYYLFITKPKNDY